jgi:hypothetical protein
LKVGSILNYQGIVRQHAAIILRGTVPAYAHNTLIAEPLKLLDDVCDEGLAAKIH